MNWLLMPYIRRASNIALCALVLAGCGGGGGSGDTGGVGSNTPPAGGGGGSVVVQGTISYQRVPFKATLGTGLDASNPVTLPVRYAVVQALRDTGAVLAETTTDADGLYSVTLDASTNVKIRVKAQSVKTGAAPTWNFRVLNNTNGDALYVLDSAVFNTGSAATSSGHDLLASTGWGATYATSRPSAPFAILDTVLHAKDLVTGASSAAVFPSLDLYWSVSNIDSVGSFCPDTGDIGTSFYVGEGGVDACSTAHSLPAGIYILGHYSNSGDTDEFDQHVIAHEFGHYIEDNFSRSDSIGGQHGPDDLLDLRVAFGEGWGDAYSGMVLDDPVYRDSYGGITADGSFNFEDDNRASEGWYSESSISEILWDIFDGANEPSDSVALGFAPIFAVMTGAQKDTDALTSIFPFANALRSANPSDSAAIGVLLTDEGISGTDAFGAGETNNGGLPDIPPIYKDILLNDNPVSVCSRNTNGSTSTNRLGNRVFLRFINTGTHTIQVRATGVLAGGSTVKASDPDIFVWDRGEVAILAESNDVEDELSEQKSLAVGTYIIEVFDYALTGTNTAPHCMNVVVTGT